MAWLVFGTWFLVDAHAPWFVYVFWAAGFLFDLWKEHVQAEREIKWHYQLVDTLKALKKAKK